MLEESRRPRRQAQASSLWLFTIVSTVLTTASLLAALLRTHKMGWLLGFRPLFMENARFDFFAYLLCSHAVHTNHFYASCSEQYPWYYPPAAIFIHIPFYASIHSSRAYAAYVILSVALFSGLLWWTCGQLMRLGVPARTAILFGISTLCTAWPVYFAIQRGNFEALLWGLSATSIWLFFKNKYIASAIVIGVVGAMKLYPLLLFGIFISARRNKAIIAGLAVTAALSLTGAWWIQPELWDSIRYSIKAVHAWIIRYALGATGRESGYDHSLFHLLKTLIRPEHPQHFLALYLSIMGLISAALFLTKVLRQPLRNQVTYLTCCMVVLPPASFEYSLVSLYIPWALIVVAGTGGQIKKIQFSVLMVGFALVIAPWTFVVLNGNSVLTSGKSLCILLLAAWAAFSHSPLQQNYLLIPRTKAIKTSLRSSIIKGLPLQRSNC